MNFWDKQNPPEPTLMEDFRTIVRELELMKAEVRKLKKRAKKPRQLKPLVSVPNL